MEENKTKLIYIRKDYWSRPIFKIDEFEAYVKDLNCGEGSLDLYWAYPKNDPDGEPGMPFIMNDKMEIVGYTPITPEDEFNYMTLGRLQSDCEYYLGFGNRNASRLQLRNEIEQIKKMKELYNSFPDNKKPEWITLKDIEMYEQKMLNPEKLKGHDLSVGDYIISHLNKEISGQIKEIRPGKSAENIVVIKGENVTFCRKQSELKKEITHHIKQQTEDPNLVIRPKRKL